MLPVFPQPVLARLFIAYSSPTPRPINWVAMIPEAHKGRYLVYEASLFGVKSNQVFFPETNHKASSCLFQETLHLPSSRQTSAQSPSKPRFEHTTLVQDRKYHSLSASYGTYRSLTSLSPNDMHKYIFDHGLHSVSVCRESK